MDKNHLRENSFDGAPGGPAGISNYQTPYGTPAGGDIRQNPAHFSADAKGVNHMNNQDSGSLPQNTIDPEEDKFDKDVDKLFTKKNTPSPDEIMCGLQFELGQMVQKDKKRAKQIVIANLRKDPQFYSRLGMMNIDDKEMKVTESKTEIKKIFQQMAESKRTKFEPAPDAILDALRETIAWKESRKIKPE